MHLVAAFMAQHNSAATNAGLAGRRPPIAPHRGSHQGVVSAGLTVLKGSDRRDSDIEDPARPRRRRAATSPRPAFPAEILRRRSGSGLDEPLHTATTKDRFGLVTVTIDGEPYVITDIGMRMLTPRELFRAQGFPDSYIIDRGADGTPITKTDAGGEVRQQRLPAARHGAGQGELRSEECRDARRPGVLPRGGRMIKQLNTNDRPEGS
jgi:DNA (cytosine-5)-methyltransferase 1